MMPLLFALGQHLTAIQGSLGAEERLMAFLDDLYVATPIPDRLRNVYRTAQQELWTHSRIRINGGKTQVWNSGGVRPEFCDTLEWIAQATDPEARVWRGSGLHTDTNGHPRVGYTDRPQRFRRCPFAGQSSESPRRCSTASPKCLICSGVGSIS